MLEGLADGEVVAVGCVGHLGDVVGEEAGEDEGAVGGEVLHVGGHVGGEDVLVDVGDDGVELALDGGGVAEEDGHIIYIIKGEVLAGVRYAEFVDVDGDDFLRSPHGEGYAEDAGASAHVEHALGSEVLLQEEGGDLVGGFVGTGTECHAGVEPYAEFAFEDGVEAVLLPFGVPVFVLELVERVGAGDVGDEEVAEGGLEARLVELLLGDVCLDACVGHLEGVEACVCEECGEYVAGGFGVGGDGDVGVEVVHDG